MELIKFKKIKAGDKFLCKVNLMCNVSDDNMYYGRYIVDNVYISPKNGYITDAYGQNMIWDNDIAFANRAFKLITEDSDDDPKELSKECKHGETRVRIKRTGEIIDVKLDGTTKICVPAYISEDGRRFSNRDLDFIDDDKWEQRLYEVAMMMIKNDRVTFEYAFKYADEFINALKEYEKKK